jgi:hypothetical protein
VDEHDRRKAPARHDLAAALELVRHSGKHCPDLSASTTWFDPALIFRVTWSNMAERVRQRPSKAYGRPPLTDIDLIEEIKAIISQMPTDGYRRVHAVLRLNARAENR